MRPLGAALLGIHHRLEQRTEDGGRHARPVVAAGVDQVRAHGLVEPRNAQSPGEQRAVDIGKGVELTRRARQPLALGRVEHVEQLAQHPACVAAVGLGVVLEQLQEDVARLEDAGVVGEQAEQRAHEKLFERVAGIARRLERIVQLAYQLGGLDGDGGLRLEADLAAEHEVEGGDVLVEVGEVKGQRRFAAFAIAQHPGLEVAGQHEPGLLVLDDAFEIIQRLTVRPCAGRASSFSVQSAGRRARRHP